MIVAKLVAERRASPHHWVMWLKIAAIGLTWFLASCGEDKRAAVPSCLTGGNTETIAIEALGLSVDRTEVTNAQFAEFTEATGYITRAERGLPEERYSGLPDDARMPGAAVFVPPTEDGPLNPARWWRFVPGANWQHPEGPDSSIEGREAYPVVHMSFEDAAAYAAWKGRRLPTAAEWESAARGGLDDKRFEWGDEEPRGDEANFWQGVFPVLNTRQDGFAGLAPGGCFEANGFGLHDMTGNVWEWTTDRQAGAEIGIVKGGSYLCARNYCSNYRPGAVQPQELTLGTSHIGFRTVADLE